MPTKKVYECRYTQSTIRIDGRLDEPAWKKAPTLDFYIPVTHKTPQSISHGKLLWDETHIYAGIKASDKDIWALHTERDSPTCNEDVLEVFLKPYEDQSAYYNFEINPLGTVYDAFNVRRGAGGPDDHRWNKWDCEGLLVGIDIKGSLNNWDDIDEYWCLEVAIPFASLATPQTPEYAATLRAGAGWGAFRCYEPLVVNDTTARLAPRTAPQPAPAYVQLIH